MQYILIEEEGTFTTQAVTTLSTTQVSALSTSQLDALQPATITTIQTTHVPGPMLYQCIRDGNVLGYKTVEGEPYNLMRGSHVLDANPPVPAWHVDEPEPPAPEPEPTPRVLTKLAYMNRFQDAELAAIYSAAKVVVQIEVWLEKFRASEYIDLSDPVTIGGLQALEAAGLLAEGRANEILA